VLGVLPWILEGVAGLHLAAPKVAEVLEGIAANPMVHDLQISLLIFSFLAFSFEGFTRHHLTTAVDSALRDLRETAVERFLQERIGAKAFEAIKTLTTKRVFARPKTTLTTKIVPILAHPHHVMLQLEAESDIMNETSAEATYELRAAIDIEHQDKAETKLSGIFWNGVDQKANPETRDGTIRATCPVQIPANTHGTARTAWQVVRDAADRYEYHVMDVTDRFRLYVEHSPTFEVTAELRAFALPAGPKSNEVLKPIQDRPNASGWECQVALLPFQGITVRWRDQSPAADLNGQPASTSATGTVVGATP